MKRPVALALVLALAWTANVPADDAADGDAALAVIRAMVDKVLPIIQNDGLSFTEKRDQIQTVVDPVFDFRLMGKLVLGPRYWVRLDKDQQAEFIRLFVVRLRDSYAENINGFTYDQIDYAAPVLAAPGKVKVTMTITSKGERLRLSYLLYRSGKGPEADAWRVYDIEVKDVSIILSSQADYQARIDKGGPDALLDELRERVSPAP
jgi:ABC-type transporter MlaC component